MSAIEDRPYTLSWQEIMMDKKPSTLDLRKFLVVQPYLGPSKASSMKKAIETVRRAAVELGLNKEQGVTVRVTGKVALDYENLLTVRKNAGLASLASFVLVAITLYMGVGSGRLVIASVMTLVAGLIWTLGFAIAFVGSLNLISVTFAVLFIGLGIDYSLQLCMRYTHNAKLDLAGSVVASDAFFPFRDGLDVVVDAGAAAVIQPGGSVRDDEVIAAADERGVAMVFTGMRHFRH